MWRVHLSRGGESRGGIHLSLTIRNFFKLGSREKISTFIIYLVLVADRATGRCPADTDDDLQLHPEAAVGGGIDAAVCYPTPDTLVQWPRL
ncbi:hypothetical protein GWI33_021555 [Rhynchophorus ferrugineus]|uniref:Uncharacterized protein n=1 Tax=Rhynchophorus ferrugineus TaxID=354439 RepID=A0A834ITK9_RHYFE|nr:hypothetical protein GWI33_021555 [Rhynchophorus ferrugineus]